MKRQISTEGLLLKAERFGDMHKSITIFSPDFGMVQVTAYGAYKSTSRFSGVTEPFRHVRLNLYHDPVRKSYKITDIELIRSFDAVQGDLKRFYFVCLWLELLGKSSGGAEDYKAVFSLLKEGLVLMDDPLRNAAYVSLTFLIRYIKLMGLFPGIEECPSCGNAFRHADDIFFSPEDAEFHCSSCSRDGFFRVPAGGVSYLRHTEDISFEIASRVGLDAVTLSCMEETVYKMIRILLGEELKTLKAIKAYA